MIADGRYSPANIGEMFYLDRVQNERRMLEMLMNNRARLLTHMAVLRICSRVALCHKCHAPAASDSLASSPAA